MATDQQPAPPSPSDQARLLVRKRVRSKTIDGLNAARMKPARATFFVLCVGNLSSLAYLAPQVGTSHKMLLRGLMEGDTGLKYHRGRCTFETGCYVFTAPTLSLGMRQKVERGLSELTGRRWRVKVRRGPVEEARQGGAELQMNS